MLGKSKKGSHHVKVYTKGLNKLYVEIERRRYLAYFIAEYVEG